MLSLKSSAVALDLKPQAVLGIMIAKEIHDELGVDFVLTSLNDSKHRSNSYHYSGYAWDSRIASKWWPASKYPNAEKCKLIVKRAKKRLGPDFDVVLEGNHIHWEFDNERAKQRGGRPA